MAEVRQNLFTADQTTPSGLGTVLRNQGLLVFHVEAILVCSAATLQAQMAFLFGSEGPPFALGPAGTNVTITVSPAGWAFDGNKWTWNNPPAGRSSQVIRFINPWRFTQPSYTYTSGGGNFTLRLEAAGFGQNTTP